MSLVDSNLETLNSDRILSTNIDITLGSADSVACDSHSLENCVGVALENGTVHKRTGVALVGVTANVLLISVVSCSEFPL